MPELAIAGGAPVRAEPYPEWPRGDDEDVAAVEEVVRGGRWGGFPEPGPKAAAFEEAFSAYQGARHGVLMSNGTVTMEVALKALGIGWGDEVIIPALTFAATVYAPIAAGALPVDGDRSASLALRGRGLRSRARTALERRGRGVHRRLRLVQPPVVEDHDGRRRGLVAHERRAPRPARPLHHRLRPPEGRRGEGVHLRRELPAR
ncbi:MAG: hypothetical protein E6G43_00295 [Actinobacteria bacterium]|nr:MAG: hypothetical protein E6G43_00295 [Actinomycetota bacterium]